MRGVLECERQRRAGRGRDRRPVRGGHRRACGRPGRAEGKAGARHVPGRGQGGRGHARRGRRVRGRAGRGGGGPGRRLQARDRSRPGRARRGAARARSRRGGQGPGRAPGEGLIQQPGFTVEPWEIRETELHLDNLAVTESILALSNGHIGMRANLDEGEPFGLPGTYLGGFYERRPLPSPESVYGNPDEGQTVVNVTNGKIIRLLVEDEPFDVRYGELRKHERVLDLRAGVLRRTAEWCSPTGRPVRIRSTRLVSFTQRAVAAILYEVESLEEAWPVVVQSELVTNESLPDGGKDPRTSAALSAPLMAEYNASEGLRAISLHRTRNSDKLTGAGMDHVLEGVGRTECVTESHDDTARLTITADLQPGKPLRLIKFIAYGWSGERSVPAVRDQVAAAMAGAVHTGWEGLLEEQRKYLDAFGERADIQGDADAELQQARSFSLVHILAAS